MQTKPVLFCVVLLVSNTIFNAIFANIPDPIKDIVKMLIVPQPLDPVLIKIQAEILPTRLSFPTFASQNGYIAFAQVVTDHLDQKRFSLPMPKEARTAALLPESEDFMADASQNVQSRTCPTKPCYPEGFLTGWLGAFGEYAHEKPQPDVAAFTFNVGGAVLGLDYNCVDENVVGFGGSYVYSRVNDDADAGNANVHQGLFGFYTLLHTSEIYYNLGLFGGYYHIDQVRNMPILGTLFVASSNTHGWQLAPHAEIGYDGYLSHVCNFEWFGIGPFVLADWVANWEDGCLEHGAGLLNTKVDGRFCSLLRAEAGLRFHETIKYCWGHLVFQEKGSYAYQKMFGTGSITALFPSVPSTGPFTGRTLQTAQNLGVFEFSVLFKPTKRSYPYGNLRYQGQFGSKFQSHQGIVEIGKDF